MNNYRTAMLLRGYVLCVAVALSACGGSSSPPTPPVPTPNLAPVAAVVQPAAAGTSLPVTLDGSTSKDPEGNSLTYSWSLLSTPPDSLSTLSTAGSPTVTFTPDIDGNYGVHLTVTDHAGLSHSTTVTVAATSATNGAPVIRSFTTSPPNVTAGTSVRFDWKVIDPNTESVSCKFDPIGDGTVVVIADCLTTQSATYTYISAGTYRPRLTAIDAKSASTSAIASEVVTGDMAVTMVTPLANAVVAKRFTVTVTLKSVFELSSVVARIGSNSVSLVAVNNSSCGIAVCDAKFSGELDLSGIAEGAQTLEVIAQDIQGKRASYYQAVTFDDAPILTVASPLDYSVARPTIGVSATCTDIDASGCTIQVLFGRDDFNPGTELATGKGSINQTIDLSAHAGKEVKLSFMATDSRQQRKEVTRYVYVDGSLNLTTAASVDGMIMDARDSRVLYKTVASSGELLHILDRNTSAITNVPVPASKVITTAKLSNYGAMLVARDMANANLMSRLYDWNRSTLYDLGNISATTSLEVNGNYAIWNLSTSLFRRDLTAISNTTLSTSASNWKNSVSSTGTAAWGSSGYQIFMHSGTTTQITNDALWNTYVVTEGNYTVYRKHTPCCTNQTYAIMLYNGASHVTLRAAQAHEPYPETDFQVRDGWAAYTELGNGGQTHVWTYDPLGIKVQRTFFAASSDIDALGDGGRTMITAGGRRYVSNGAGHVADVNTSLGESYYIGNQWYVAIGRVFFSVPTL